MPNITTNHLSAITYTNMTKNNEVADIEGLAGFTKSNRRSCENFYADVRKCSFSKY